MKEKILVLAAVLISFGIGFMVGEIVLIKTQKPNALVQKVVDRSLDKYTIPNLADSQGRMTNDKIQIQKELKDYPEFTSNEFIMEANLNLDGKTMSKVSGLINIPKKEGKYPLLVMIRGYVPTDQYFIGNGTINGSIFFANHGFITVSPDFLGYGDSDKEPDNVFEARFQTYTTMISLLKSINSPAFAETMAGEWDGKNIFIWAHSNGGNIALTALEATGVTYPTVLWAPVSAPFPFSILYYSDEPDDKGKFIRRELAKFEDVYDTDLYSLTNYLTRIKAPIQLNQGTADDAVPAAWSDDLAKALKDNPNEKDDLPNVIYNKYPGAGHEMTPLWNSVIQKDLEFFEKNLIK